ncbi:hypothetical protein IW261DRAFT_1596948 [Armillaria novae-zelandiae]|uniref:Uncharacterized protein n=1 Tax=Armillaria novae-zelandiae TaxID=153914 RepID=A0AA39NV79_9AGAR|nr:hypothetical protein IW261DRAFT_1596948 [Armillaria novae-zelandiae]
MYYDGGVSKATNHPINLMAYSSSFRVIINSLTQTRPDFFLHFSLWAALIEAARISRNVWFVKIRNSNFGKNATCDIWDRSWYSANHLLIDIHNDDTNQVVTCVVNPVGDHRLSIALHYATEICISPFPQRFSDLAQFTDTKKIEGQENLKTRPCSKLPPPELVDTFELTSLLWHQYVQGYLSLRTGPPEAPHVKTSKPVTYRARTGPDTILTLLDW